MQLGRPSEAIPKISVQEPCIDRLLLRKRGQACAGAAKLVNPFNLIIDLAGGWIFDQPRTKGMKMAIAGGARWCTILKSPSNMPSIFLAKDGSVPSGTQ